MNRVTADDKPAPKKRMTRTRDALCNALLVLLEEKAFEQITVKEITARANIGYATFFRRYSDKDGLLHDLVEQEIRRLITMSLPLLYSVDTLASTQALCSYVWEHRKLWTALLTGGAAAIVKEEYLKQALKVAEDDTHDDGWLPAELSVTFSVTATNEILTWWLKQERPAHVNKIAEIINRLVIAPVYYQAGENPAK